MIMRGLSNTVMVGERPASIFYGRWAFDIWDSRLCAISPPTPIPCGSDYDLCPKRMYFSPGTLGSNCDSFDESKCLNCDLNHFWSFHSGGANWLLADGSVQFMTYDAGETIIPEMASIK